MVLLVAIVLVIVTVLIHNEVLMHLSGWLRSWTHLRLRFALAVLAVIFTHAFEIGLFVVAYYVFVRAGGHGALTGAAFHGGTDVGYFSFVTLYLARLRGHHPGRLAAFHGGA